MTKLKNAVIDYASPGASSPLRLTSRGMLLLVAAIVLFGLIFACGRDNPLIIGYELIADGLPALAWIAAMYGIGSLFTSKSTPGLRFVTSTAMGLGITSLVVLGLGLAGWMNQISALAILAIGLVLAWIRAWPKLKSTSSESLRAWLAQPAGAEWLWLFVVPMLAVMIFGAMLPPGALWGDEPNAYDVLEYHLQVPREWFAAGRISPLEHNVFSYFPFGVEMHYLLAMHLKVGPWRGMYLAQMMHGGFCVLALIAIYSVARQLTEKRNAILATILAAACPWIALLSPVAYNEGGLLLYGTVALGWAILGRKTSDFVVAGAMAGFACGVKLTGVPMLLLAVPVAMVLSRGALKHAAVVFVVGTIVFSPWLIRNFVWARNPVFPEAMPLLGRAHFSVDQMERWQRAHSTTEDQKSPAARATAFWDQVLRDWKFGYVLIPISVVALALSRKRPEARLLGIVLLLLLVFWLFFTHLEGRFFVLAIPIGAMLVALANWPRQIVLPIVAAAAVTGIVMVQTRLFDRSQVFQLVGIEDLAVIQPVNTSSVPSNANLALVGDATAFMYSQARLQYRTVFDIDAGDSKDGYQAWMKYFDQRHLDSRVVNYSELRRLSRTYWKIPPPPAGYENDTVDLIR